MKKVDLSGMTFGRLRVVEMVRVPGGDAKARCQCECGREKLVVAYNLRSGNTRSCGCLAAEVAKASVYTAASAAAVANFRHGMAGTATYQAWRGALSRCYRPRDKRYAAYGGRGIEVCPRWRNSFDAFLADMGPRPDRMTLDRIDVNGNYEPSNCRWATRTQQARNMRTNVASEEIAAEIRGLSSAGASAVELAKRFGMTAGNVDHIVKGRTWRHESDMQIGASPAGEEMR